MKIVNISNISEYLEEKVCLQGWLYNKRSSKKLHFLQVRDGTGIIQCIVTRETISEDIFSLADRLSQESSIRVEGVVKEDKRSDLGFELHLTNVVLISESKDYPISKKVHGDTFLMDHRHLWLRSKRQNSILRIRHTLVKAIRDYFDERNFVLVDTPILTPNSCEGTSTLFEIPYFDKTAYLSQSGQLYQEAGAMAFGKSYCFGPTFRAEKSKTRRHLTEFWMVEPEVAYMNIEENMQLAEDFLCVLIERVLNKHAYDLKEILKRDIEPLNAVKPPFVRLFYTDAIKELKKLQSQADSAEKRDLLQIEWGSDLGSPHETELTKKYDKPIIIYGFPSSIKAFYMKKDPNDARISLSMDILAPEGYGEIIGGGQREDDLSILENSMKQHDLPMKYFDWYMDLRRYGSVPHAGFGMGLERLVAWVCGLSHVRETIPFARTIDRLNP